MNYVYEFGVKFSDNGNLASQNDVMYNGDSLAISVTYLLKEKFYRTVCFYGTFYVHVYSYNLGFG